MDYVAQLKDLPKKHDFFIGFDSDGCVFDTMELKHKECFCPAVIKHMECQPVSKAAREVWDFVNLYSKTRGCNRFLAIQHFRDLLRERKDVQARKFKVMELKELDAWIERETKLGNPALTAEVEKTGNEELKRMLDWSLEVNSRVADMSQTPLEALEREWEENDMTQYVNLIAGQEHGTKSEHILYATEGKGYDSDKILKVGDAPGDYKAAMDNHAFFYPIIPGLEEMSWQRLVDEGLNKFFNGTFAGTYQQMLLNEFDAALPDQPSWN
jgi:phosphoglycolate phosphatase-like HAD superfamily hydrolase